MLKKTIVYKDLDGNPITQDFYFNLTKAELVQMEFSAQGGLKSFLEKLVMERDGGAIMSHFESILGAAYGERDPDGIHFIKSDDRREWNRFKQKGAWDVLFMELIESTDGGANFIRQIVPSDLAEKLKEGEGLTDIVEQLIGEQASTGNLPPDQADTIRTVADYTEQELLDMPQEEFDALVGANPQKWPRPVMLVAMRRKEASRT